MATVSSNGRPAEPHIDRASTPLDNSKHVVHTSGSGGGSGSGGATTIADGADVAEGSRADTAATGTSIGATPFSVIALLKGIYNACVTSGPEVAGSPTTGGGNRVMGSDGTNARDILTTTTGALAPPTAAVGKIVTTVTNLAANTSTVIYAANPNAIAIEIQIDGTAQVAIDRTGGTLTSNAGAGAGSPLIIPTGSFPLYTMPVATLTAMTAYTSTAQTVRVTAYLR